MSTATCLQVAGLQDHATYSDVYSTSDDNLQICLNKSLCGLIYVNFNLNYLPVNALSYQLENSMIITVYKINDTKLLKAVSNTDLGVEIDSFLMFDQHIDKTCNKAKQRAAINLKCFKSRNPALLVIKRLSHMLDLS